VKLQLKLMKLETIKSEIHQIDQVLEIHYNEVVKRNKRFPSYALETYRKYLQEELSRRYYA
jgi:hypothetical protein